jgi:hypothetical protein
MHEPSINAAGSLDAASALQDYCAGQIAHIATALGRRTHPHRSVHEARKGIRRLRSVLAFGAKRFGAGGEKIDRALQRLGRGLSRLRDAHVALELARARWRDAADAAQRTLWSDIIALLTAQRAQVLQRTRAQDAQFRKRLAVVARAGAAIAALPWQRIDNTTLRAQLARSRRRADRAARRARRDPLLPAQHRWRKRLRRQRMQITALLGILDAAPPSTQTARLRALVEDDAGSLQAITAQVDTIGKLLDAKLLQLAVRRLPQVPARKVALARLRADTHSPSDHSQPDRPQSDHSRYDQERTP